MDHAKGLPRIEERSGQRGPKVPDTVRGRTEVEFAQDVVGQEGTPVFLNPSGDQGVQDMIDA
jgi:hypothetical protein